jgi:hypothetical protein
MKRISLLLVFLISVCVSPAGFAQPKANERADFVQEGERIKRENPAKYERMRVGFTVAAEMLLARLGYDVGSFDGVLDEKTTNALRLHQKNRRIPETGDPMSFDTVKQVSDDGNLLNYAPVILQSKHVSIDLWDRGYVLAQGTWVIAGEAQAWPEQTSTLKCDRALGTCSEATAVVSRGEARVLSVDLDTYEIERWDQQEIVTKPLERGCARYVRRFNRVQQSVSGIRSTISRQGSCASVDNGDKFLVLTNGIEVYSQIVAKHREDWSPLFQMSPGLVQKLAEPAKK